jgi:elongation factor P--(R)-beta-lysine ligase
MQHYLEVDTPVLTPSLIPEPAIQPFKTSFNNGFNIDERFFLVPSPEIWMKKLLSEGSGNLFQICKSFRNGENIGKIHNPEFTILEWYTLESNYIDSISIMENMLKHLLENRSIRSNMPKRVGNSLSVSINTITMEEVFRKYAGFSLSENYDEENLKASARRLGLSLTGEYSWEQVFNLIFVHAVEPELENTGPIIITDYPSKIQTLAMIKEGTPWAERWELYLGGIEIANCFSESTNPRLINHYLGIDKNLPPCSGVALGVDRLIMYLLGHAALEGVIYFPFSDILDIS